MGSFTDPTGRFIASWVAGRIPHVGVSSAFGPYSAIGWMTDDGTQLLGGAVYNNYVPSYRSIEISCASDTPRGFSRPVIGSVFRYPFGQLQVERITSVTPKRSASARRFLEKLGFKREGAHPKAYGDFGDAISYGLLRKDWEASRLGRARLDGQAYPHAAGSA